MTRLGTTRAMTTTTMTFHSLGSIPEDRALRRCIVITHSNPSITIDTGNGQETPLGSTRSLPLSVNSEVTVTNGNRGRTLAPQSKLGKSREPSPAPSATLDASWWGDHLGDKKSTLPWKDALPKRKHSIPAQQLEGLEHTKQRVALAVRSVLGNVADVSFELLSVGVEFLELAPVPGLAPAAKTLLAIWESVQQVDVNVYGCLRLTERCADLLISIRQEVREAGDHVGQELAAPIAKLEETFAGVLLFMQKQVRRPFLKRYLKRDEIQRDLADCDAGLRDAVSMFGLSIQIRILKQVQETERQRRQETQALVNAMIAGGLISRADYAAQTQSPVQSSSGIADSPTTVKTTSSMKRRPSTDTVTTTRFITTANALGLVDDELSSDVAPSNIISTLTDLQQNQNSLDSTRDFTDIRQLMRRAIQAKSDAEMLEILQVKDDQMPEAIKTLQRALERVAEKQQGPVDDTVLPPGVVVGKVQRSVSIKEKGGKKGKVLQRSRTMISIESSSSSSSTSGSGSAGTGSGGSGGSGSKKNRDTLDYEFIETGISALMRMSRGQDTNLPSWTITKYEVNREKQIGVGGFSKVYKGTWNNRTVAIKVLKLKVTKKLFIREVEIWKTLHHPHILELYGASSATDPPWFFVSPYMKHGNLVEYLRKVEGELSEAQARARSRSKSPSRVAKSGNGKDRTTTIPLPGFKGHPDLPTPSRESTLPIPLQATQEGGFEVRRKWDLFRFMHEIAEGMVYLHHKGVLHGDLKAANVLVDDDYTCVITDFGQSEIKSEAYRLSGESPPHQGTMRWQAPEILTGEVEMTKETDVYAFAIACVEIVNLGKLPWGIMLEDEAIRQRVLKDNARPTLNESPFNTPSLQEILKLCWHRDPTHRPQFSKISRDLELLQKSFGKGYETPKKGPLPPLMEDTAPASPSPDMRPFPLPPMSPSGSAPAIDILQWDSKREPPHHEETVVNESVKMPEPVIFTHNKDFGPARRREEESDEADDFDLLDLDDDVQSLAPTDERLLDIKNEQRYRLLLTHHFHPSLVLPLWSPSDVRLGAVGFLSRPKGEFVTLFNAYTPDKSSNKEVKGLPSIHGYGKVTEGSQKQERTLFQKGLDSVAGWMSRSTTLKNNDGSIPIRRRYTMDLRAGHKAAHLCTESTEYKYFEKLDAPKKWFAAHIDTIVRIFGREHNLQREDIVFVVGLLRTPNYGLFVSHSHPDGHAHFNVYASPKAGQPWGTFTTDSESLREPGPSYEETNDESRPRIQESKVSNYGGSWDTVLIARLRFKPDAVQPTAK
ncbi:hypothetical protein NMY22_g8005 [Coprinellus aureogranulatus]|nr:hypothetical protein NMY22_g8005 [Coprinellus aureogranulatus]